MDMWYVDYNATPDINKVISNVEQVKKQGVKAIAEQLKERNHCIYVFSDEFEYRGKQIDSDTMRAYKEIHGKLKICIIK